jgi:hypothetical protein
MILSIFIVFLNFSLLFFKGMILNLQEGYIWNLKNEINNGNKLVLMTQYGVVRLLAYRRMQD